MTAVEFLEKELYERFHLSYLVLFNELIQQAKEMEKDEKNNLPIHIHEGISNTQVYIEDGVVHVKPNETLKSE